jgi:hypothetical protein
MGFGFLLELFLSTLFISVLSFELLLHQPNGLGFVAVF